MHQLEGDRLGLAYTYALIDFDDCGLPDEALPDVVGAAAAAGFAGLNVTHPFKQSIIDLLNELASEAASIGAVNSIVFDAGRSIGHNTDSWGFIKSFQQEMDGCELDVVLLLGAGGGGAAVAHALLKLHAGELQIFDPVSERAAALVKRLSKHFGHKILAVTDLPKAMKQANGLVNATPIGMSKYPGAPVDLDALSERHWVTDIVYFPIETELLRRARQIGCRTLSGAGMAIYQAVKAFELFTGIVPDATSMARHFDSGA
jgi:shikimate dehydrogenase